MRNEGANIERCLASIAARTTPPTSSRCSSTTGISTDDSMAVAGELCDRPDGVGGQDEPAPYSGSGVERGHPGRVR